MVAAASAVNRERNTIHLVTEADITEARRLMAEHRRRTGERLSLTAYVVACLARTFGEFPRLNSFRKGRRLIVLDDVTIAVVIEREIGNEALPEPVAVRSAGEKSFRRIHDEIREAQQARPAHLGADAGFGWTRLIPAPLLRTFIRLASRSIAMQKRYGVVGVTAVGMFAAGPLWLVPLTAATVTVSVGGIETRTAGADGTAEARELLCLTLSFDHDVVDGAPAARFAKRFGEILTSAEVLAGLDEAGSGEPATAEGGA